jgi:hypothetical protein
MSAVSTLPAEIGCPADMVKVTVEVVVVVPITVFVGCPISRPVTVFVDCPMATNRLAEIRTPAITMAAAMTR